MNRRLVSLGTLLLVAVLSGCESDIDRDYKLQVRAQTEKDFARCEALGGFPIRSWYDNSLADCRFYKK